MFNSNNTKQLLLSEKLSNICTYKVLKYDEDGEANPKYFFKIRFKRMSERKEEEDKQVES